MHTRCQHMYCHVHCGQTCTPAAIINLLLSLYFPLYQHLCEDADDGPLIDITILALAVAAGTQRCCRWQPEAETLTTCSSQYSKQQACINSVVSWCSLVRGCGRCWNWNATCKCSHTGTAHGLRVPHACGKLKAQGGCKRQQHQPAEGHPASACQDRVYAAAARRSAS